MIRDFAPGQTIDGFFVLRKKELRTRRDSNDLYLSVELGDASGRITGSLWEQVKTVYDGLQIGRVIRVWAKAIDWKEGLHLSIRKIDVQPDVSAEINEQLLPHAPVDVESIYEKILGIIETVSNRYIRELLSAFFGESRFRERFCRTPGGKLWHHAYVGGLAEHTWSVLQIALDMTHFYPNLNKDRLIAGALLHDIGKMVEFQTEGFIDYSTQGRLHGHIAIGYHRVAACLEQIEGFPADLSAQVLHLILAHQGSREQGSPVLPMTREAIVLYYADEIDSKMNAFERIRERDGEPERKWSRYVNLMDRFLYLA